MENKEKVLRYDYDQAFKAWEEYMCDGTPESIGKNDMLQKAAFDCKVALEKYLAYKEKPILGQCVQGKTVPRFVKLNNVALRYKPYYDVYHCDGGCWEVGYEWIDDKLLSVHMYVGCVDNVELIPTDYKTWKRINGEYAVGLKVSIHPVAKVLKYADRPFFSIRRDW